jgi:hypothetical protein
MSLEEIDSVLERTATVEQSIPAATLRRWRNDLVRASVFVSYAIGVLSLDVEVLGHSPSAAPGMALESLVNDLPDILASGWVGGGWSLSPDASASVAAAAAAEAALDQSEGLLGLHMETVVSDLGDPDIVRDLLVRVELRLETLIDRRDQLESRIRRIQEVVLAQYGSGAASVDDWLS